MIDTTNNNTRSNPNTALVALRSELTDADRSSLRDPTTRARLLTLAAGEPLALEYLAEHMTRAGAEMDLTCPVQCSAILTAAADDTRCSVPHIQAALKLNGWTVRRSLKLGTAAAAQLQLKIADKLRAGLDELNAAEPRRKARTIEAWELERLAERMGAQMSAHGARFMSYTGKVYGGAVSSSYRQAARADVAFVRVDVLQAKNTLIRIAELDVKRGFAPPTRNASTLIVRGLEPHHTDGRVLVSE